MEFENFEHKFEVRIRIICSVHAERVINIYNVHGQALFYGTNDNACLKPINLSLRQWKSS